jgi:hypothetical protein
LSYEPPYETPRLGPHKAVGEESRRDKSEAANQPTYNRAINNSKRGKDRRLWYGQNQVHPDETNT